MKFCKSNISLHHLGSPIAASNNILYDVRVAMSEFWVLFKLENLSYVILRENLALLGHNVK